MVNYAHEIEEIILGTCLSHPEGWHYIKDTITSDAFYLTNHKVIFKACLEHEEPDIVLVESTLKDWAKLNQVGGTNFLADLMVNVSFQYEKYCQVLLEKQMIREIIAGAQSVLQKAGDNPDAFELLDEFERISSTVGQKSSEPKSLTPSQIHERDKNKPKAEKLFTGISNLDMGIFSDSMKKGQFFLTIADSGHGKTQAALFIAECFLRQGYKIGWFQLEGYDSETASMYYDSVQNFDNIHICDSLYDIEDIKREARRLNREHDLDFIVFDYVQNIECRQNISKTEKVEYISKQIQKMAKELNVVCNPLSQVTINESRSGWAQEPRYNDVRWSKQLKQDADLIVSIFRPSRIDSLVISEEDVKDWNGNEIPYNSVFMKQAKVRHGRQEFKRLHLLHTDSGLKPFSNRTESKAPF